MADPTPPVLRHLDFSGRARASKFTAKGGGTSKFQMMERNRAAHARKLEGELLAAESDAARLHLRQELADYEEEIGINLEIRGAPGKPLKLEPLDAPKFGVVLKNVRTVQEAAADGSMQATTIATVFVRDGKLSYLVSRIQAYAKEAKRDNEKLVANIESIGLAAIEAFWTSKHPLPELDAETWWEVWVRAGTSEAKRTLCEEAALAEARKHAMEVKQGKLVLPEHSVFLLKTTRRRLAAAAGLLNFVSELRHAALTPAHFVEQAPVEQHELIETLKRRVTSPPDQTSVCILDTGVNRGHPLLADILHENDHDTVRQEWGKDDHAQFGHGTQMAGLAAYGDLTPLFTSNEPISLTHRLESVKILPRFGQNEPEHYGPLSQEAMAQAEANAPERRRVYALAVTATDAKDYKENGKPSAWSSALDSYASGSLEEDETKRLICVSAGNVSGLANGSAYPSLNELSSIEDPAQSWNALTIGAYTEKDMVYDERGNLATGWSPLASKGGLCPESCTSVLWSGPDARHWPIKPDLAFEGGNRAVNGQDFASNFDSLSLLTTNADFQRRLLTSFNATSAATALAARMGGTIRTAYPNYWPETVRALMVHSADWTNEMRRGIDPQNKSTVAYALQRFGWGVPDLARAMASARSRATLIAEDSLQPFEKVDGRIITRDMMLYRLPWPKDLLQGYGDADVRFRATLSYFIEPNPGSRMVNSKYRYAGCNLRFQAQTPTETLRNFVARVSDAISDEDRADYAAPADTAEGWMLGDNLRRRGSLHSDTWTGPAAKLAQMEHVIVFPVNGWWRLRPQHQRYNKRIRYSLIMTLESPGADIDIYTPIQTAIAVPVTV